MATDITMDLPATDARPGAGARAKRLPLIIVGILVIAAATWGVRQYLYGLSHVSTDNAQLDGHITVIAPRVPAFVSRVLVDDNQHVKAGDTLVVLDDRDLKVRLQQAKADLANAEAAAGNDRRAGQAHAQLAWSRAQQASAEAAVNSAEANFKKAAADLERIRGLAANKIVARATARRCAGSLRCGGRGARVHPEAGRRGRRPGFGLPRGVVGSRRPPRIGAILRRQRPAPAQLRLHSGADRWHHREAERGGGGAGANRSDADVDRAGSRPLGDRKPQGDPARKRRTWAMPATFTVDAYGDHVSMATSRA